MPSEHFIILFWYRSLLRIRVDFNWDVGWSSGEVWWSSSGGLVGKWLVSLCH